DDFADIGQGRRQRAGRRLRDLCRTGRGQWRFLPCRLDGLAALEQAAAIVLGKVSSRLPPVGRKVTGGREGGCAVLRLRRVGNRIALRVPAPAAAEHRNDCSDQEHGVEGQTLYVGAA